MDGWEDDGGVLQSPTKEVIVTNIGLRIEEAAPTVGFGAAGTAGFTGTESLGRRARLTGPLAYRRSPVLLAMGETV
jgi:hypothetical protein